MENRNLSRMMSFGISDTALQLVMGYINDPRDRGAISLVCRRWHQIDSITRKHVTVAPCYSTSPDHLRRRFPQLESLKLKGKPRAAMFNLIPEDWGGYSGPWIKEIAQAFKCLTSLHLRRMIVNDEDIEVLVGARGRTLVALKLDKCSGFSTDSLKLVAISSYRSLKTLFLEESVIEEKDGDWLHELAMRNTVLETLNFHTTELKAISCEDLELIARNCRSLICLKISDSDLRDLGGVFRAAAALEEFSGGSFNVKPGEVNVYQRVNFPPRLCGLGLLYMGLDEMPVLFPYAAVLKNLDLQFALLGTEDHCELIERCPNLEVLEARNVIGDRGLEVVARRCKRLRRLRIERGDDENGLEDEQGIVSQTGLIALAQGCPELEYLAVYVSDITNAALECIGAFSRNLYDFRMVLLDRVATITDLPLDNGVRSLLMGCTKLRRFALYLRPGGLTDVGLCYVGQHAINVRWMLLGLVGETDNGLLEFSSGCPNLQRLEMRGCRFSERALAHAVLQLTSLRYIWVQGYNASPMGTDLLAMVRPYWNIELIPPRRIVYMDEDRDGLVVMEQPAHVIAYYSLAGQRTDHPSTVVPLNPSTE